MLIKAKRVDNERESEKHTERERGRGKTSSCGWRRGGGGNLRDCIGRVNFLPF